uniref:Uncharacterized protein n=1 Tax=Romanomermis culicivorax TaxID=13658 RepID=A0A915IM45_ROMCU
MYTFGVGISSESEFGHWNFMRSRSDSSNFLKSGTDAIEDCNPEVHIDFYINIKEQCEDYLLESLFDNA